MKQWDIFLFPHPSPANPHPVVVISNDGICSNEVIEFVNALACQSVRPLTRAKKSNEVYLNGAGGLDAKTLVKCDFVLVFAKKEAIQKRGEVSPQRIAEIRKRFQEHF
jgi:mRNA-degrading endonuclease toxin of MazEF toxin-antitoxin module